MIHPFEILTIGGDDVMLIVPANKALQIAETLGKQFEAILLKETELPDIKINGNYVHQQSQSEEQLKHTHRYQPIQAKQGKSQLNMSTGVLITAMNTPVYYAENLTNQLLKSAKKKAKYLKKEHAYHGGTVDFLTLKSVTMISSKIKEFREEALEKESLGKAKLKLYAAPYTLHELGGLIDTIKALKQSSFPKSQLYQIRSFLEQGKNLSIINYRYFRVRLAKDQQELLEKVFEQGWCKAKTNNGNLAPWMYDQEDKLYETIWREIVELYPFIEKPETMEMSGVANSKEVNS